MSNENALDANRKGRLALTQIIYLVPLMLFGAIFFLLGAAILGGIFYNLVIDTFKGGIFGAIFGGGLSLVFLFLAYFIGGKSLIDILIGQVRQVEGRGDKYSGAGSGRGGSRQRVLYYSVDKLDFQIPFYGRWKKLPGETIVRAYYTPLSKTLVNVENIYTQSSPSKSAGGSLKPDFELEGLQKLEKAEKEARKQK